MTQTIDLLKLPRHIAIIMDGNGRWARRRGLPRLFGHRQGVKAVREIVEACANLKIQVVTLYAFSTENWARPGAEIRGLMMILKEYLRREFATMMKNNIRLRTIGDIARLPSAAQKELSSTIKATSRNTGMILNLALNYGGRQEIVSAVQRCLDEKTEKIDESAISRHLDTAGLPDPDLLIRTSGEMRISNFLLWQLAYCEWFVTPVLWPDFKTKDLHEAIIDYQNRDRRFGRVKGAGTLS